MNERFADTYYLLALVNTKDKDHVAALAISQAQPFRLVTTMWVLVEFADALSSVRNRTNAARFIRGLFAAPLIEIVPPTAAQFELALDLFEKRPDKDWSLTDCLSFQVMNERGITDALTADQHFVQAGFRTLFG